MIGLIRRLSVLSREKISLPFTNLVRNHLDYGDILYDKPYNQNFANKLETVQYKNCIVITGAIQSTSRHRLYDELGLISLSRRRWYNKLIFFY